MRSVTGWIYDSREDSVTRLHEDGAGVNDLVWPNNLLPTMYTSLYGFLTIRPVLRENSGDFRLEWNW